MKLLISLVASAFLLVLLAFEGTKVTVHLNLDGDQSSIRTHSSTVGSVLAEAGIEVNEHDVVNYALNANIENNMKIEWRPAKKVFLSVNGKEEEVWTIEKTVNELIKTKNISVSEHDRIVPGLEQKITDNMAIAIDKAIPVTLTVAGKQENVWTTSTTVADFLRQQNIKLNKLDKVQPDLDKILTKDMAVNVVRVEKVTDVVEEPLEYATVTRKDPNLAAGSKKVIEPGQKGLVKKHYTVTLENGKEVSRELINTETVKESKDRIVAMGTKQLDVTVSRGKSEAAKEMYMVASAYTAYCNGCTGVTSTGINLRNNPSAKVVAVDPDVIPLGTKIWVEGYGYAIAGDTGSAIKGERIDLFIADSKAAKKFGKKKVRVKILE